MRKSVARLTVIFMVAIVFFVPFVMAADSVSTVNVTKQKAELTASAGVDKIRYFTLDSPKRLVVDLYGVQPGQHSRNFVLSDGFNTLRVGPYEDKTRFVFDVSGSDFPIFNVDSKDEQVVVTWKTSQTVAKQVRTEPATSGSAQIKSIDFSSVSGESILLIGLSGETTASEPVKDGNKVLFSLRNSTLPRALRREFDTLAFPSAIHSALPYLVNAGGRPEVRFTVTLKGDVPYRLQKTSAGYSFVVSDGAYATASPVVSGVLPVAVEGGASKLSAVLPLGEGTRVKKPASAIEQVDAGASNYTGAKTSLVFDNADVRDILRLIAEISELNIIASDDVAGNVTLRLIDVPWDQALELVLDISDLGMLQEGNVVRVLPKEKIRAMKEAELTATRSQEKLEPLTTEVVTVSYADLGSVAGPASEILSERGSITEDSRNKMLIITDVKSRIDDAKALIEILDTPERQVMIEARIVQVASNYSRDLGINWFLQGQDDPISPSVQGIGGAGGGFLIDPVDAAGTLLATPGLSTQVQIGEALVDDIILSFQLSALEADGKGKVISTPRVTTLNGETALISQGTSIPYQTSGNDGPKTEFVNAELKLEVTPVINPDNTIILDVLATNDSPSLTAGATAPSIDTKKAQTKVLVNDGATTVIGGIFVENESETEEGVPYLMNVPILGNLFKSSKVQTTKDELLIFITPRIIHDEYKFTFI